MNDKSIPKAGLKVLKAYGISRKPVNTRLVYLRIIQNRFWHLILNLPLCLSSSSSLKQHGNLGPDSCMCFLHTTLTNQKLYFTNDIKNFKPRPKKHLFKKAPITMTLATEFAETTRRAATQAELRLRVLQLYRKYMRYSKEFCDLYELDMPVANVKTKIRQEFERQRFVNDLGVSNVLLMKGQMEFQELVNFWKQQCHVLRYFDDQNSYNVVDKNDFVKNFLRGN